MKKIVLNIALVLSVFVIISCDKDFNTIGSDVIGDNHFNFENKDDVSVIAYTKATGPVQSNNLPVKALGIYNDPFFGTTKASFVTQISLPSNAPYFGLEFERKEFDIVNLYIPYSSTQTATGTGNARNTYELKDIYGVESTTFNLQIFRSNYLLRDFDATDPSVRQKYYSDQKNLIEGTLGTNMPLNDNTSVSQNTAFKFSNEEILIFKKNDAGEYLDASGAVTTDDTKKVIEKRYPPGMWIQLNRDFFYDNVLTTPSDNLLNNSIFHEHIKGLYFQVESNGNSNALALLDFSNAFIEIQYHSKVSADVALTKNSLNLTLTGNSINFFENNYSSSYTDALGSSNSTTGDELLYLKGGNGSVAFIDLFGADDPADADLIPEELEQLRSDNILVNDAFLTFYVKKGPLDNTPFTLDSKTYATRIYLYDATNNVPILDYIFDSSSAADPKNNKLIFGGILEVDENKEGIRYRIRIRSHINNIINGTNESTNGNVRLGLSVTQNINNSGRYEVKNAIAFGNQYLPIGSIIQPKGAVIYGNNTTEQAKKLKLEIYYTKPN